MLAIIGFGTIDNSNADFTRFGSPALNIAPFAAIFVAFGLLVAPLADSLELALPPGRPPEPWTLGRALSAGALDVGVALCILIGASGWVFRFADNPLYGDPIIVLLLLACLLPRQSRWPIVALLALVVNGTVGALRSIGNILIGAYGPRVRPSTHRAIGT